MTPPTNTEGAVTDVAATIDSGDYKHTFFGILNKQGEFWTPLAFASSKEADAYLAKFVAGNPEKFGAMLGTHRAVPVRIHLTHLTEQGVTAS